MTTDIQFAEFARRAGEAGLFEINITWHRLPLESKAAQGRELVERFRDSDKPIAKRLRGDMPQLFSGRAQRRVVDYQPVAGAVKVGFIGPMLADVGGFETWLLALCKYTPNLRWSAAFTDWAKKNPLHELAQFAQVGYGRRAVEHTIDWADVIIGWVDRRIPRWLDRFRGPMVCVIHAGNECARVETETMANTLTHIVAVSEAAKRAAEHDGPITVIENGLDFDMLQPERRREENRSGIGLKEKDIAVGNIGRLTVSKGVLRIAETVAMMGAPYRAVFVGEPFFGDPVTASTLAEAPGRPIIVPPNRKVGDAYQMVDVVVNVCPTEGFGYVYAEAAYCERPIVSCRAGIAEQIPGVVFVEPGPSPSELSAAIKQALATPKETLRAAKRTVEQLWSAERMGADWERYLAEITKGATDGRPRTRLLDTPAGAD